MTETVEIEEVDGRTAAESVLEQMYAVESGATEELLGGEPAPTAAEGIARYRNPSGAIRRHWLARVDGEPAGVGFLSEYGPAFATGEALVAPPYRRGGIGAALIEVVRAAARERGLTSFFGHHGTEAGAAFARHVGARDDQRDVKSILRLREAGLPEPVVPAGMKLRSWVGAAPDDLAESLVRARSAMSDAPMPGSVEWPVWTVEDLRVDEQAVAARGMALHVTVVLDGSEIVSLTGVRVRDNGYAGTDDTTTVPSQRGRGLAYAVKLESLRSLRDARPDVELIGTMNAEHNAAMRAVNAKIGFVPTLVLTNAIVTL